MKPQASLPTSLLLIAAVVLLRPLPMAAQNRAETQLLLELRALQEQVQRMQLAVNQLSERVKNAEGRIDGQASDTRKGFADQKVQIDAMANGMRSLNERESEGSVRIGQLSQEMKSIRDGLQTQQATLSEIVNLLQPLSAAAFASGAAAAGTTGDPAGGAASGGQTGLAKPPAIPPSPTAYYNTAFGYYYASQFENAITALGAAIQKFPDHPDAAKAQLMIGEAYFQMGRHKEALTAFTAVITNYKDSDVVPDAYYKQGGAYEQLGQIETAIKSYETIIRLYKGTTMEVMATTALRRLKVIKG